MKERTYNFMKSENMDANQQEIDDDTLTIFERSEWKIEN